MGTDCQTRSTLQQPYSGAINDSPPQNQLRNASSPFLSIPVCFYSCGDRQALFRIGNAALWTVTCIIAMADFPLSANICTKLHTVSLSFILAQLSRFCWSAPDAFCYAMFWTTRDDGRTIICTSQAPACCRIVSKYQHLRVHGSASNFWFSHIVFLSRDSKLVTANYSADLSMQLYACTHKENFLNAIWLVSLHIVSHVVDFTYQVYLTNETV